MRFEQVGEFDFTGSNGGVLQRTLKVTVTPFGAPNYAQAVIDPAQGGVI